MNIKRILATLLCFTMIMTSGAFTSVAYAGETGEYDIAVAEPVTSEETEGTTEETAVSDTAAPETEFAETGEDEEGEIDLIVDAEADEELLAGADGELTSEAVEELAVEELAEDEPETDDEMELQISKEPSRAFVDAPGTLTLADESLLSESIILPEGITTIPTGIFDYTDSENYSPASRIVKSITLLDPDSLVGIEQGAFLNSSVESIQLGENCTEILDNTFKGSNINTINLNSVETIGESAFEDCKNLRSIDIKSVETIGKKAFKNTIALNSATFGTGVESIGVEAFMGSSLKSVDMSKNTAELTVGAGAFSGNSKLTDVSFSVTLKDISESMFAGCDYLTTFLMRSGSQTASIGAFAFKGCTRLSQVTFREKVVTVGNQAFADCGSLKTVSFYAPNGDITIDINAFDTGSSATTIEGYDGKVKEYAARKGYRFNSLNASYVVSDYSSSFGSVVAQITAVGGKKTAKEGETVYVTVTPKSNYALLTDKLAIRDKDNWGNPKEKLELVSCTTKSQVFKFTMPAGNVVFCNYEDAQGVTAKNLFTSITKVISGELKLTTDAGYYNVQENTLAFRTAGLTDQLKLSDYIKDGGTTNPLGPWNFSFVSSDTKVASVDTKGLVTAHKKGTTNITISAQGYVNKKISIIVNVGDSVTIKTVTFDKYFDEAKTALLSGVSLIPNATAVYEPGDDFNPTDYYVVEFSKDRVAEGDISFVPLFDAYQEDIAAGEIPSKNYKVKSAWTSSDKKIATFSNNETNSNDNTVNIKKGTVGEAFITATVTNDNGTKTTGGFILRVLDPSPRLHETALSINRARSGGTDLNVTEVYGYELDPTSVKVCILENGAYRSANETEKKDVKFFEFFSDSDGLHLTATSFTGVGTNQSKTFGAGTYYLRGVVKKKDAGVVVSEATCIIPLPKITVGNALPKVSLKASGKINTFYNEKKEDNYIDVLHGVKDVVFDDTAPNGGVELVSAQNYKTPGSEAEDSFAWGFDVEPLVDNTGFRVRLSGNTFKRDANDRAILSGYVKLTFKGYNDPFYVKYTIPTQYVTPTYTLSTATAKASKFFDDPTYEVQLLNKKKEPLALVDDDGNDLFTVLEFDDDRTLPGVFDEEVLLNKVDENKITFSMKGEARNGSAYIQIQMVDWARPLYYKFAIVKAAAPVASLKPNTASLNLKAPSQVAKMKFAFNLSPTNIVDIESITYTGSKNKQEVADSAADLIDAMELDDEGNLTCKLPSTDILAGTYTFKAVPVINFIENGDEFTLSPVSFKVTVANKAPVLKLKKGTFTLNAKYANIAYDDATREYDETLTSLTGVPAGSTYTLDTTGVTCEAVGTAPAWDSVFNLSTDLNDAGVPLLRVKLKEKRYYDPFKYTYTINGLGLNVNGDPYEVDGLKIVISGTYTEPSLKIKSTGTLNQVDPESTLVDKITVSGIHGTLSAVDIQEVNRKTKAIYKDGSGNNISYHFEAAPDPELENVLNITLNQDHILDEDSESPDPLVDKATYNVWLFYKLKETGDKWHTYPTLLKIVPKETLPKLVLKDAEGDIVVGDLAGRRTIRFFFAQNSVYNAIPAYENEELNDTGIRIYPTAKDITKQAFTVSSVVPYDINHERHYLTNTKGDYVLDSKGNKKPGAFMTMQLVQPSTLVCGQEYNIPFEIRFKNQNKSTTGVKVSVKTRIIK